MENEQLQNSLKFKNWRTALQNNEVHLVQIDQIENIWRPDGYLLFSLLEVETETPENQPLLPIVLLRGDFVSVLIVLIDKKTAEKKLLLVKQRRVANGDWFYEHCAGMMDNSEDPFEVALLELDEETGLTIDRSKLFLLNEDKYFSSPGLLDEGGYYFYCELKLSSSEIAALDQLTTGDEGAGEHITTCVASFEEAHQLIKNAHGKLALMLYEQKKGINTIAVD